LKTALSLAAGLILIGTPAMAGAELTAQKYPVVSGGIRAQLIEVINKGDTPITIKGAEVNRGNCQSWTKLTTQEQFGDGKAKPRLLNFGDTFTQVTWSQCNILEITLETDQGKFTLSW